MPVKQFTAWSYSRLAAWEDCPLRAKLKLLDKKTEPEGPALARGNLIHGEAANYLTGKVRALPSSLVKLKTSFKELKAAKPMVEQQWAFDVNWQPVEWFAPTAHLRIICDAVTLPLPLAVVVDHKTGKLREGYQDQVELFALGVMAKFAEVKEVRTELWYLDHGQIIPAEFDRSMETKLRAKWAKRVRPMLIDKTFAPRPGWVCRYCDFRKEKQGLCPF